MSDETMVTERQAILRERAAFVAGVAKAGMLFEPYPESWSERANKMFPLPTVTRPRVVADSDGVRWTMSATGVFAEGYVPVAQWFASRERIAIWADLLANPTEEVEADA